MFLSKKQAVCIVTSSVQHGVKLKDFSFLDFDVLYGLRLNDVTARDVL